MADDPSSTDAIFRIVIDAPIDRIWRELTKTDENQGAIFNARLHTTGMGKGARIQLRTGSGQHVMVVGEVVELDPPHRYVHTHRFTEFDDPVCQVSYDLRPVAGGVEVTMRIIGLPAGTRTGKSMQQGGHTILKVLKAIAETGKPPLATRLMYAMFGALEFVLPKRTRSEHWPMNPQ
jgi:uncharacterized protein YndB with AHSA1/START domain